MSADISVIGLAVMGRNLALNIADHGFTVAVYNRTASVTDQLLASDAKGKPIVGAHTLPELVGLLKKPRRFLLMVRAGDAVDSFISQLLPLLESGDIIMDGGNSDFQDTIRRTKDLAAKGFNFVGMGVSGGEDGARTGPSLMPGGAPAAWPHIKSVLQSICAKSGSDPCCDWVGEDGAGHFVKMVHNGIEYGDMQLIGESFHLLRAACGLSYDELQKVFLEWNKGELESFLIEITAQILGTRDTDGAPLLDKIVDVAGQKGTGKWTVREALEVGTPATLISEAVMARFLSGLTDVRGAAVKEYASDVPKLVGDKTAFIEAVREALYASKIISYAQGYMMFRNASKQYNWNLNYGGIALMWRGGCIIRSRFLGDIKAAFDKNPQLQSLLLDPFFSGVLKRCLSSWRQVVSQAVQMGIPVPAFSSALSFFDGIRCERLPAFLLQAQRDYFGAHTFQRVDKPASESFHFNWTGHGGDVSAGVYTA